MNIIETIVRSPIELANRLMNHNGSGKHILTFSAETGTESGKDIRKPNFDTKGTSGVSLWGNVFNEEYLSDLKGHIGAKAYDKMQRQDYQIAFVKRAIKAVVKSADFHFTVPEGVKNGDVHAKACEWQLRKGFKKTWRENLNDLISHRFYGFAVFEPTDWVAAEIPEIGLGWKLNSLGFRSQKTITGWSIVDDNIEWVHQQTFSGSANTDVKIDGNNLIVLSEDMEGMNVEGVSILRASYGPYWMKQTFLKLLGIGLEKSALGVIVVTVPPNQIGKDSETKFLTAVKNYVAHQNSYLKKIGGSKEYEGFNVEVIKIDFNAASVIEAVKLMDDAISASVLAMFGRLGQGGNGGAYNLGVAEIDFFFTSVIDSLDYTCEKLQPIWDAFVYYNFGKQEAYPELEATLEDAVGEAFARTLNYFYAAGVYTPQPEDEMWLRKKYKMPDLTVESLKKIKSNRTNPFSAFGKSPAASDEDEIKDDEDELTRKGSAADKLSRQSGEFINKTVKGIDFKKFNTAKTEAYASYNRNVKNALLAVQNKFLVDFENKLKLNPNDPMKAINNIEFGFTRQLKEAVSENLMLTLSLGKQQGKEVIKAKKKMVKEAMSQSSLLSLDDLSSENKKWLRNTTTLITVTLLDTLKKEALITANNKIDQNSTAEVTLFAVREAMEKWIFNENNLGAGAVIPKALDQGRDEAYGEMGISSTGWIYFNINPVTEICKWLTGRSIREGDPNISRFSPPNHWGCDGFKVPLLSDEEQPVVWDGWNVPQSIQDAQELLSCGCGCGTNPPEHWKFWFEKVA